MEKVGLVCDAGTQRAFRALNARLWRDFESGTINKATLQTRRFEMLLGSRLLCGAAEFNAFYLERLAADGCLIDGALEICRSLSHSHMLAIATNGVAN